MHVFEILSFNLKNIRFKDNKDYFDSLLKDLGISYSDIAFCFSADYDGKISERVIKQFPELKQYRTYHEESDIWGRISSDFHFSSIYSCENNSVAVDMDHRHIQSFESLLKKIPRPFNFGFMGVVLDKVSWDQEAEESEPLFTPNALGSIIPSHRFGTYYSNSIRFFKEFDYGNRLNLVEIMTERTGDFTRLLPRPLSFCKMCEVLGKPMDESITCVFSIEETDALRAAGDEIKQIIKQDEYDAWFTSFESLHAYRTQEDFEQKTSKAFVPIKGVSLRKIFGRIAKEYGYQYGGCHNGTYVYHKNNAANHQFTVEIDNKPFSAVIDGHVSISGYNFHFCFIGTPQIIAADGEIAVAYCEKLFEAARKTEETFSDKLFSLYGATPEWYIVNI